MTETPQEDMKEEKGELILYTSEDGLVRIQLRAIDGTVWLTQAEIARLFDTTKQNVGQHVRRIFADGELQLDSVVKNFFTTAPDGKSYRTKIYNLQAILAVGYRVRSLRGVQFRRWATTVLKEYLFKGFSMDDERLKDPAWDYFDELLERIRDIRASEARFYRKVRDILALSEDYDPKSQVATDFYANIQNKMLYAVTTRTAAELIVARADPSVPNMGLTTWSGARSNRPVRKRDVGTSKNYLSESEIRELNLIVTMFLDAVELRAGRRQTIRLVEWENILDEFLLSNELPLLCSAGSISSGRAEQIAHERYTEFDAKRKEAERAEKEQLNDIEELEKIAEVSKSRTSLKKKNEK